MQIASCPPGHGVEITTENGAIVAVTLEQDDPSTRDWCLVLNGRHGPVLGRLGEATGQCRIIAPAIEIAIACKDEVSCGMFAFANTPGSALYRGDGHWLVNAIGERPSEPIRIDPGTGRIEHPAPIEFGLGVQHWYAIGQGGGPPLFEWAGSGPVFEGGDVSLEA